MKPDIHRQEQKVKSFYKKVKESSMCDENKEHICNFFNHCQSSGLSPARLSKTLWQMRIIGETAGKDLKDCTKEDVERIIITLMNKDKIGQNGKEEIDKKLSPSTIYDYKVMIKKFWKWLKGNGIVYPIEVATLKNPTVKKIHHACDMFNDEDILKMLASTNNIRLKAIISMFYEMGVRAGELLSIRIKDIQQGDLEWTISITNSKTDERTNYIYDSIPYLSKYLDSHPYAKNPEAFLWNRAGRPDVPICYERLRIMVRDVCQRAGITKPINLHNHRHSAITKGVEFMTDQQIKLKCGLSKSSRQLETYSNLRSESVRNAERKHRGIEQDEDKSGKMGIKICRRCDTKNTPDRNVCERCFMPLNLQTSMLVDEWKNVVMQKITELLAMKESNGEELNKQMQILAKQLELDKNQKELKELEK